MEKSKSANRYSAEVRARAVRMVVEHGADHASQWAAIGSIAAKIGCTAETLRGWVRQAERDQGGRAGSPSAEQARIKALEREVRELRQANEILRKASAYFAMAELDRRFVLDALEQALHERRPVQGGGLVHHSDRGVQPEFKGSSQHLERGGCDDCSEAAFGSVWAKRVALAWSALCCAA